MPSSIEIDVSANIAKFKSSMDKAALEGQKLNKNLSKAFKGIGTAMKAVGALAGVAVAGGILAISKASIDAADNIQKLGIRTGSTAEFLSEMRFSLSQNDVSLEAFGKSLTKINKSSQDAADGLSTPKRAFDKLGISVEDFNKLDTDSKFVILSEAISRVDDPAQKAQIAMDIMGKSGVDLLTVMQDGAAGIDAYRAQSVKLGQSLTEDQVNKAAAANDAIDKLTKSLSGAFSQTVLNNIGFIEKFGEVLGNIDLIGIALVEGLLVGFENIKKYAQIAGEGLKLAFLVPFDVITESYADLVALVGKGAEAIGATDLSASIDAFSASVSDSLDPLGDFNNSVARIEAQSNQAIESIKKITGEMVDDAIAAKSVSNATGEASSAVEKFTFSTAQSSVELKKNKDALKASNQAAKDLAKEALRLASATGTDLLRSQEQLNKSLDEASLYSENYKKALEQAHIAVSSRYIPGTKEYQKAMESLGFQIDEVATKSVTAQELMIQGWKKFQDGVQDSFFNALRSGENFFDSLKNVAFDILAQIGAKIATTFVFDKLGLGSGGGGINIGSIVSGISSLIGGGSAAVGVGSTGAALTASQSALAAFQSVSGGAGASTGIISGITKAFGSSGAIGKGAISAFGAVKSAGASLLGSAQSLIAAIPGWGQAALAAVAAFAVLRKVFGGARSFEQILKEDYLPDLLGVGAGGSAAGGNAAVFGNNNGLQGSGLSNQFLANGGENGNGGFFTGAQASLDEFERLLNEAGFDYVKQSGGVLKVFDDEKDIAAIQSIWQQYNDSLESAIPFHEVFKTSVENDLLKPTNLFFENFSLGFNQNFDAARDSLVAIDGEFDKFVSSGISKNDALFKAISDHYGIAAGEAELFVERSGRSIEQWTGQFSEASGENLRALINFNDDGVTSFGRGLEMMSSQAESSFSLIRGGLYDLTDVALSEARRVSAAYSNAVPNNLPAPQVVANNEQSQQQQQQQDNAETNATLNRVAKALEENVPFIQQIAAGG